MAHDPTCAVCGGDVPPDMDHTTVAVEQVHTDARNDREEYYLHDRCRRAVFAGWAEP